MKRLASFVKAITIGGLFVLPPYCPRGSFVFKSDWRSPNRGGRHYRSAYVGFSIGRQWQRADRSSEAREDPQRRLG